MRRRNPEELERLRNRRRNRPPASSPGPQAAPVPVAAPVPPPVPTPNPGPSPPMVPDPPPTPTETEVTVSLPPRVATAIGRDTMMVQGSPADLSIVGVILNTGCYEPHVMEAMIDILPVGGTFVDVGANIGVLSLLAALHVGDHGTVLAIEASPVTYPFLLRNLASTGRQGVIPINRGAWDVPGTRKFCHLPHITGGSHITITGAEEGQVHVIPCEPLDTLVTSAGLHRVDLIKVDVEGAEIRVLHGARHMLATYRPPMIIEFNRHTLQQHAGESVDDLYRTLRDYGYHMKILMEDGTIEPATDFAVMENISRQWTLRLDVLCERGD